MTTIIRTPHLTAPAALLLLFLGCSGESPVKIEPLSSAFTTEVLTESWLAIEHDGGVTVMRPDGTDVRRLSDSGLGSWSPGAVWLSLHSGRHSLAAHNPTGGETIPLYGDGWFGAWSPDAAHITYTPRPRGSLGEVRIREVASGDDVLLGHGTSVDWSSDGEWIAAEWYPPDLVEAPRWLHLLRTDQSGEVRDLGQKGAVSQGVFSADSRWFMYSAGSALIPKLRAASVDGSEDVLLQSSTEILQPTWSPIGDALVFASGGYDQFYTRTPNSKSSVPLSAFGWYPLWSPNGEWIAYRGSTDGHRPGNEVRVMSYRSAQSFVLGETTGSFSWSPDSRLLAIAAPEDSSSGIYLVDPRTGERRRVADGSRVLWSPPAQP